MGCYKHISSDFSEEYASSSHHVRLRNRIGPYDCTSMRLVVRFRISPILLFITLLHFLLLEGHDLYFLPASRQATNFCGRVCKFRLCEADGKDRPLLFGRRVPIRPPGNASTPWVCLPEANLGAIRKVGEARVRPVREIRNNIPISEYERTDLSPSFSSSFFSLAEINEGSYHGPSLPGKYGIVREKSIGTQDNFLDDLCVQIPITKYELVGTDGSVEAVVGEEKNDCVGFTVKTTQILVELTWDTNDDLDLSLREPSGEKISFSSKHSERGGRLLRDVGGGRCEHRGPGKEQIVYDSFSSPQHGKYVVRIRHYQSCPDNKKTQWYLSIYVNGKLIFKTKNNSFPGPRDRFIRKRRFRFPVISPEPDGEYAE